MTTSGAHGRQSPVTERLAPPGDDTDTVYYAPREGDLAMLALLLVVVLGTGAYTWHQLGGDNPIGRAIFFGLFLFCVLWVAVVYTFKLSFGVVVGPHGLSITRGPWRTELSWSETARLVERTESNGQRNYRWVVAMAYDTRRLQVREDMVSDYDRFRQDVYLRYRNWQEHGGTWGTAASGPFTASDDIRSRLTWQLIAMALLLLPGLYFTLLLPKTGLVGPVILLGAAVAVCLILRTWLGRQTYAVDNHSVSARRPFRPETVLRWRAMTKVERVRHPFGWAFRLGILVGNGLLELAARGDSRVRSFPWAPRVPEYLILRGAGHQVRIRLHQLARPDELLAWVEFYERIGRHATTRPASKSRPLPSTLSFESPDQPMPTPAWGVATHTDGQDGQDGLDTAQTPVGVPRDPWAATEDAYASAGATSQPTTNRPPQPQMFPPPSYTPAPRHNYETEYRYAASAPGSMPTSDDDAWLRETEAHLRASRPGSIPGAPSHTPQTGTPTQRPAALSGPLAPPTPPAGHTTRPAHPSQPAEQATRPPVPTHPTHPARPTRPPTQPRPQPYPQPSRPTQPPYQPQYQPGPTQPRPQGYPPMHPPTHPPMPAPSTPVGSEHDDGFDQPSMDFQHAPPPPLPRFGPTKPEE